ncbi:MAG: imelysin family protein, partial [Bacteroidota bacterium]
MLVILLAGTIVYSCGDDDGSDDPDANFDRQGMLNNIGANLIVPGYQALDQDMDALDDATDDFLNSPTTDNLNTVRNAFRTAYQSWQRVSPYEFGPADQVSFRSSVNNYPVDASKVEDNITNGNFNLDVLANNDAKGFPAIDYLLYEPGLSDQQVADRFDSDPTAANRGTYLSTNVEDISSLAETVYDGWAPDDGNYLASFVASTGIDVGSSLGLLVNGFNQHYERNLRDGKVGIPVGVRSLGIAQPERSEAFYSGISLDLAAENMNTIENIYLG